MELGTWSARAGVAHHPKIVGFPKTKDVDLGVEIRISKQPRPMIVRFLIELARIAGPRFVNRRVKPLRGKFPTLNHQFPRPFDCFLLKIIAKTPVPEHFEKRVVISIESDVVEIVVFAAGANAFLGVGHAGRLPLGLLLSQKNRHELVHARVGEKQIRSVGQKWGRRHDGVLLLAEEIEKRLADLGRGHRASHHE